MAVCAHECDEPLSVAFDLALLFSPTNSRGSPIGEYQVRIRVLSEREDVLSKRIGGR
jgi:hypothetical protein